MDAYVLPPASPAALRVDAARACGAALCAGLRAVMDAALAGQDTKALAARCDGAALESFTNNLGTVDTEAADAAADASKDGGRAAAAEATRLWAVGDGPSREAAVLALLADKLGAPALKPADTFSAMGGNSFVAMQAVGALREVLGLSVPVFELLTKPFGAFAAGAVRLGAGGGAAAGAAAWLAVRGAPRSFRSAHMRGEPPCPTYVFFPQAGSSARQFASVYSELIARCPLARCLFVQPPGRDVRASEPNETDLEAYLTAATAALRPHLVGAEARPGPCVFVGDSFGAIAAFEAAHALQARDGFTPTHVVVSGNASPAVTATHHGLGSWSNKLMADLTEDELRAFLAASGVQDEIGAADDELLAAFRADCVLYEAYVKPAEARPRLRCRATVLRGANDAVTRQEDLYGWLDEFERDVTFATVDGATHHAYEEQPLAVAARLAERVGELHGAGGLLVPAMPPRAPPWWTGPTEVPQRHDSPASTMVALGPPCGFVRGVDEGALHQYRKANALYRLGSPIGSKGELTSLPDTKETSERPNTSKGLAF